MTTTTPPAAPANRRRILIGVGLALLGLAACGLIWTIVQRNTAPAPTDLPSVVEATPQYPTPAIEAPAAPAADCLSVESFANMWKSSKPSDGPGPLIQVLNNAWDMSQGKIGTGWPVGPMTVAPVSLVWTDLLSNPMPAGSSEWVPLRLQGKWGVYVAYATVTVPTPGRSARLCASLDPARDLAGW